MFYAILASLIGYFLGSLHVGYFAAKKYAKKDLSREGTGNIGATNAFLVGGKSFGTISLVFDIGKGMLAVYLARVLFGSEVTIALAAWFAVLGHDFSFWLNWKGGKGVATTGGAIFAINPALTFIALGFWILAVFALRYYIPATVLIICFLPLFFYLGGDSATLVWMGIGLAVLAVIKHFPDLLRFFSGKDTPAKFSLR